MKKALKKIVVIFIIFISIFKIFPSMGIYAFFLDNGNYDSSLVNTKEIVSDINELSPRTKKLAVEFIKKCKEQGLNVKIAETYRSKSRQLDLYEQGRSKKGNIVTWTKNSKHTSRRAFDICKAGNSPYTDEVFFKKCAEIGRSIGLTPGYYFKGHQDKPHYELNAWWLP